MDDESSVAQVAASEIVADHVETTAETHAETAVAVAELAAETEQSAHERDIEIARIEAAAATEIAETVADAQNSEVDAEWIASQFAEIHARQVEMSEQLRTMAEAVGLLAQAQIVQPILTASEPVLEPNPLPAEAATPPSAAEEGPREAGASEPRRRRRLF